MILSNIEIRCALDEKRLFIEPEPLPRSATNEQDSTRPLEITANSKVRSKPAA